MKVAVCDDQEIYLRAVDNEIKDLSYLSISLLIVLNWLRKLKMANITICLYLT